MKRLIAVLLLFLGSMLGAETCDVTISVVPFAITSPGRYCLGTDLYYQSISDTAIPITVDDVTVNLSGHSLVAPDDMLTRAVGIGSTGHSRITIRNGNIRNFAKGVAVDGNGILIERLQVDGSTMVGIYLGTGSNGSIRDCIVTGTGGSPWTSGDPVALFNGSAMGIRSLAAYAVIERNTVSQTLPLYQSWRAYGIAAGGSSGIVHGNAVLQQQDRGIWTAYYLGGNIYMDNVATPCQGIYREERCHSYQGGVPGPGNFPDPLK